MPTVRKKVPDVTIYFWVIKILATTVGETVADFLATRLHLGLAGTSLVMSAVFVVALFFQIRGDRYVRSLYWTVVVSISVVGTLLTDTLVDTFGVPLQTTAVAFASALAVVFALWWRSQRTLSVHEITTREREGFYWATILFTFALGTSAGDLVAESFHLGYPLSVSLFAAAIGATALAYFVLEIDGVLAFWIAYVLTRPLGASLGDLLSQSTRDGGLGFGTTLTSVGFLATIASVVLYLGLRQKRIASLTKA
ncbi:MAG: membrane protein [Vulcanimicrobiaceae bacterium]